MLKKKIAVILTCITIAANITVGCNKKTEKTNAITISGSTSVGPIVEKEGEEFKSKNPHINVEVNQLGSSAGIKDAISGIVQIGMSSRDLKEEETKSGLTVAEIAYDGIAVITNKANPINNLTISQLKDIFTGKTTNWKDVGGKDGPIVIVSREDGSGTRDSFQDIVGFESEELNREALIGDGSGNIKTTVSTNENSIGYISFEYIDKTINPVSIDNVEPIGKTVLDRTYKISRPFLLVYKEDKINGNSKKFIDFILSEDGQKIVEENGLIKIK